jgi:hypothetical protein
MAPTMGEGLLMNNATAPILLVDGLDVSLYGSLEELEIGLEPLDVKDYDFLVCDAEGRLVQLEARSGRVMAWVAEEKPTHAAELEGALREFLKEMGSPEDTACDLPCLIEASRKIIESRRGLKMIITDAWRRLADVFRR